MSTTNHQLVDRYGRMIPFKGNRHKVVNACRDQHYLIQPEINYAARLRYLQHVFPAGAVLLSEAEFRYHAEEMIRQIGDNNELSNLLRGVYLPVMLPQLNVHDYGTAFEDTFLSAVERSFCNKYPNRTFNNQSKGDLTGKVTIVPDTRHEELLPLMANGPVVLVYFPTALQGFGFEPTQDQFRVLHEPQMLLSGGFDIATAMAMYPDVLGRDTNVPGLYMNTITWDKNDGHSFYFDIDTDWDASDGQRPVRLNFDNRDKKELTANGVYSGGLSFVASVSR